MSDKFHCGDEAGLLSYAYDDCEPSERRAIAAHLAHCVACADAVAAIADTRQALAAWTPPEARLGFRVTASDPAHSSAGNGDHRHGLVTAFGGPAPRQWWRQPLPAWAQLAAAALIFAVGMSVGASTPEEPASSAPSSIAEVAELRQTIASLESRIADAESRTVTAPQPVPARFIDDSTFEQSVRRLIAESEQRQDYKLATLFLKQKAEQLEQLDSRDKQVREQMEGAFGIVRAALDAR